MTYSTALTRSAFTCRITLRNMHHFQRAAIATPLSARCRATSLTSGTASREPRSGVSSYLPLWPLPLAWPHLLPAAFSLGRCFTDTFCLASRRNIRAAQHTAPHAASFRCRRYRLAHVPLTLVAPLARMTSARVSLRGYTTRSLLYGALPCLIAYATRRAATQPVPSFRLFCRYSPHFLRYRITLPPRVSACLHGGCATRQHRVCIGV